MNNQIVSVETKYQKVTQHYITFYEKTRIIMTYQPLAQKYTISAH